MVASIDIVGAGVAIAFVVATLAWVAYAVIRPMTHRHYHHTARKLWRPLD
jgi:hypothetical protein